MDAVSWTVRAASCIGKASFSSPQLAAKVMKRRGRRNRDRRNQHVYRCKCCGLFHIGSGAKSPHAPPQRAALALTGDDDSMG